MLASSLTLQSLSNAAIAASESAQSQASQSEAELTPQVSSQATPRFAPQARPQPVAQSLDEILENEQAEQTIIEPGSPVGTEIRNNERIQGEVEAEIDEVILRQVPDARLLEDIYTLEIAPVLDSRVEADRRTTVKIAGQVNDENGELINHDVVVTHTTRAGAFTRADHDID